MKKAICFFCAALMCVSCAYIPVGRHGFGVDKAREGEGVVVHTVQEGSPAEKAGIEKGDVIVSLEGRKVEDPYVVAKKIAEERPGKKVLLKIVRQGMPLEVELLIEKKVMQVLNANLAGDYPDYALVLVENYFWIGSYPYPMSPQELENLRTHLDIYDLDHIPPLTVFTLRAR